jgi:hypothetical protein
LRARGKRPRRRGAHNRNEFPSPHKPPSKPEDGTLPHRREAVVCHSKSGSRFPVRVKTRIAVQPNVGFRQTADMPPD